MLDTLLDLRGAIPNYIHISDGLCTITVRWTCCPPASAFYMMDRGDADFGHLYAMHQPGAYLGNSENAMRTQIWRASATDVLIAIVKKELRLKGSLYTCLQILPAHYPRLTR